MRIEITWSKVESTTFLLLRNALDLFRNLLDRCFIEITLSKVKSISFFWKMFLKIRHVWWQAWIKHHGYLSQEFVRYLWHFESRYLIENLLKILLDLQNLKERDEREKSRSEKNRDEYGFLSKKSAWIGSKNEFNGAWCQFPDNGKYIY